MDNKEKLITTNVINENDVISDEKFQLAKQIAILQRHIILVDYSIIFLRLRYDEEIAQEVRNLGYTIPAFTDPGYQKALEAIASLDHDRVTELRNLIDEFKNTKK